MSRHRINALIDATSTYGDGEPAIANLAARKPAFWSNCGNSNALAGELFSTCNLLGGIEAAQDDLRAHFARHGRDVMDRKWLDTLLPLNHAAVMDLLRAYQNVGTFRSPAELERRTERFEAPSFAVAAE